MSQGTAGQQWGMGVKPMSVSNVVFEGNVALSYGWWPFIKLDRVAKVAYLRDEKYSKSTTVQQSKISSGLIRAGYRLERLPAEAFLALEVPETSAPGDGRIPNRFRRGSDGWGRDSYRIPGNAVAFVNYTGEWFDSPSNKANVDENVARLQAEVLDRFGVKAKLKAQESSNVFMVRLAVLVPHRQWREVEPAVYEWLEGAGRLTDLYSARA